MNSFRLFVIGSLLMSLPSFASSLLEIDRSAEQYMQTATPSEYQAQALGEAIGALPVKEYNALMSKFSEIYLLFPRYRASLELLMQSIYENVFPKLLEDKSWLSPRNLKSKILGSPTYVNPKDVLSQAQSDVITHLSEEVSKHLKIARNKKNEIQSFFKTAENVLKQGYTQSAQLSRSAPQLKLKILLLQQDLYELESELDRLFSDYALDILKKEGAY